MTDSVSSRSLFKPCITVERRSVPLLLSITQNVSILCPLCGPWFYEFPQATNLHLSTLFSPLSFLLSKSQLPNKQNSRRMYVLNSQLKVAYRAQQKAQIAESKASHAKKRFASYIFHEVRVPLNTASTSSFPLVPPPLSVFRGYLGRFFSELLRFNEWVPGHAH